MDVMELVENEPNARPFQCDWQTCSKVSNYLGGWDPSSELTVPSSRASTGNLISRDITESIPMNARTLA